MKLLSPTSFTYNPITRMFHYNGRVVVTERVIVKQTLSIVFEGNDREVDIGPGNYTLDEIRRHVS